MTPLQKNLKKMGISLEDFGQILTDEEILMKMMRKNNSRAVGNQYERQIRLEFIALGWDKCQTSRYASREQDDANVDLCGTVPFNVQIKRWKSAPSYQNVLKSMPKDSNYNVIIHKKPNKGEVVVLSKEDFYELIKMLKVNQII